MKPLGSALTWDGGWTPRLAWESRGAGARLGSPPEIPGVDVDVCTGPTDEMVDESAVESGFVGFFK
jgi:hypothetical protein